MYFSFLLLHRLNADELTKVQQADLTSREKMLMLFMLDQDSRHFPAVKALTQLQISRSNLYKLNSILLDHLLDVLAPGGLMPRLQYLLQKAGLDTLRSHLLKQHHLEIGADYNHSHFTFYKEFYNWLISDNSHAQLKIMLPEIQHRMEATSDPALINQTKAFVALSEFRMQMFTSWREDELAIPAIRIKLLSESRRVIELALTCNNAGLLRSAYDSSFYMYVAMRLPEAAEILMYEYITVSKKTGDETGYEDSWFINSMRAMICFIRMDFVGADFYFKKGLYPTLDKPVFWNNNLYLHYFMNALMLGDYSTAFEIFTKWAAPFGRDQYSRVYSYYIQIKITYELSVGLFQQASDSLYALNILTNKIDNFKLQHLQREFALALAYAQDDFGLAHTLAEKNLAYLRYIKKHMEKSKAMYHAKFVKVMIKCVLKKRSLHDAEIAILNNALDYEPLFGPILQRCFDKHHIKWRNEPLTIWIAGVGLILPDTATRKNARNPLQVAGI